MREEVFQAKAWRQETACPFQGTSSINMHPRRLLFNSFPNVSRARATQRGNEQILKTYKGPALFSTLPGTENVLTIPVALHQGQFRRLGSSEQWWEAGLSITGIRWSSGFTLGPELETVLVFSGNLDVSIATFIYVCVCSVMSNSATLGTVAHQAPLSTGFPRQEYSSGLPFPSPGYLPHPGFEPTSLVSLVPPPLQADSLQLSHRGSPYLRRYTSNHISFSTLRTKNLTPSHLPPIFPSRVGCCSSCLEGSETKVVQKRTTLSAENKKGWELEHCSSSAAAQGFFGGWNRGSPASLRKGSEST